MSVENSEMYIVPGLDTVLTDLDEIYSPVSIVNKMKCDNQNFACYICGKVLPWAKVSSRNIRPFLEGQTYMCNKCDGKKFDQSPAMMPSKLVDEDVLNAAIMQSAALKGIHFHDVETCKTSQSNANTNFSIGVNEIEKDVENKIACIDDNEEEEEYAKRRYTCSFCNLKFKRNGHLMRHLRTHSEASPIYKCDDCEKCYKDMSNLNRHKKSHIEFPEFYKPYTCGICEKKFRDNYDLQRHVRIHTGEQPFKCTMCEEGFIDNRSLKKHIKVHNGERNSVCPICKKGFLDNRALNRHVRTYKGEVHYKCDVCDKTFHKAENLMFHMKTHNKEHHFKCHLCDEGFLSEENFKMHSKIHVEQITSIVKPSE